MPAAHAHRVTGWRCKGAIVGGVREFVSGCDALIVEETPPLYTGVLWEEERMTLDVMKCTW